MFALLSATNTTIGLWGVWRLVGLFARGEAAVGGGRHPLGSLTPFRCYLFGQGVKTGMTAQPILTAFRLDVFKLAARQWQRKTIIAPSSSLRRKFSPKPIVVALNLVR